ncbi:GntR family transcriptional regulator [Amycolatopsis albispora]|uniref:UbiC family transcriptional regulator n=1 Tax=Amycolatopsis albispora TaxID=1804986 RepID=A0A344L0A3_9PSEU|nr:UTRA domain-containing protein [Amycolatopsis albispora]AXB41477.1 UbiC family transcriptional regulator [Amycolatopsis albispora]
MTDAVWTSVSLPYVSGNPTDAWGAEAATHGQTGTQQLADVTELPAPDAVADALGLPAGAPVVVRRRIMLLGEQPVELTDSYYPATLTTGTALAEHRKIKGGAVALLHRLGYPPRSVREDVTARLATPAEQTALELPDPACVLQLSRVLFTDGEQPIEASIMTMTAQNRRLRYQLTL